MSSKVLARVDGAPLLRLEEMIWVGDIPALGALRYPERDALVFPDGNFRTTYSGLEQQTNAFVRLLRERGVLPGDRIAYLGRNNDLFFPVLFGAIRAGVVLVPINWRLAVPEIAYQLEDSRSRLLVCDTGMVEDARAAVAGLQVPPAFLLVDDQSPAGLRSLLCRPASVQPCPRNPEQIVVQMYTSGTTGNPKGVLISHQAFSIARHADLVSADWEDWVEGGVSLSPMPNFHIGGMCWVLMGLVRMATVVITCDPSPLNVLNLMRTYAVERCFLVATAMRAVVDELINSGGSVPPIKGLYYGAMVMSERLLRDTMGLFGCSFGQFFGMTELTGTATFLGPRDHDLLHPQRLKSLGRPLAGMSLEIRGTDRQVLGRGEHGEIWIKTPTLMSGYWQMPGKTQEAVVEGWYATGDGGYLDDEGFLHLTDRIKDMIVSGGENVYPAEVEEAFRQHPAVLDAAVVGLPDERWGEAVVAVIELRPDVQVETDELSTFIRARIAGYKCPKTIRFGSLPRTASGKVQRNKLRERIVSENPWD
ncbi:long-chain fatty acid--CoA ligase [Pseudomonas marginalis]|uniref:Long-chain fatty acid--CoA ligase n=1 Tax=Pseudomonas marginalis TaxID=298 RepID=A0A9X9FWE3_PSEMA|nr:AMP-binding protein [Pseudomonas marginalis]TWR56172.1 long-chain fatty acid--CoA ligase [Pseudomonas marginalis]SEB61573.1 long-chain acyl-CoA synthetase [Pseudomonas marginalis]